MKAIKEVAEEVTTWAFDLLEPELIGKYEFPPEYKDQKLPDVACEITDVSIREVNTEPGFNLESIEQRRMRVYSIELMFMTPPDPPDLATFALYDFIDLLTTNLESGGLKNQYYFVSRTYQANFRPAFVEFDDGTRGRQATLALEVGERIK